MKNYTSKIQIINPNNVSKVEEDIKNMMDNIEKVAAGRKYIIDNIKNIYLNNKKVSIIKNKQIINNVSKMNNKTLLKEIKQQIKIMKQNKKDKRQHKKNMKLLNKEFKKQIKQNNKDIKQHQKNIKLMNKEFKKKYQLKEIKERKTRGKTGNGEEKQKKQINNPPKISNNDNIIMNNNIVINKEEQIINNDIIIKKEEIIINNDIIYNSESEEEFINIQPIESKIYKPFNINNDFKDFNNIILNKKENNIIINCINDIKYDNPELINNLLNNDINNDIINNDIINYDNIYNKIFYKKEEAIKYINEDNLLFAQDYNDKGLKQYIIINKNDINIKLNNNNNLYEVLTDNKIYKLYLDIETENKEFINNNINNNDNIINKFIDILKNYLIDEFYFNNDNLDIIILKSENSNIKFSYHIIINNIIFYDKKDIKKMIIEFKKTNEYINFINSFNIDFEDLSRNFPDIAVYGKDQLIRCINQSKIYKNNKLINISKNNIDNINSLICINQEDPENENNDYIGQKKYNINNQIKINNGVNHSNNYNYNNNKYNNIDNKYINIDEFKILCDVLYGDNVEKRNYFKNYNGWLIAAYNLRNLNNSNEAYLIFDEYSRKIKEYQNIKKEETTNIFYSNNNQEFILIRCLLFIQKLNPDIYIKFFKCLYLNNSIPINNNDNIIKINNKYICDNEDIININKNYKCLMIKSPYGTGKTYFLKEMIKNMPIADKMLYISYRQSLSHSIYKDLKNDGFNNYLSKAKNIFSSDRLICQLDSLKNLKVFNYDYIILDEIEGILNHLSFNKIDQKQIYDILIKLLKNSKKILCFDGDLSKRSLEFIEKLNISYKLFINEYKPNFKNFIFTKDNLNFDNKIELDIINKNKTVIICMNRTTSEKYNAIYKNKCNVILHNGIESDKKILNDVNEEWQKADLLIYSPTIEAGIDFNIQKIFNRCYIVLSNQSTSPRALLQMTARIRHYIDDNILCLIPKEMNDNITANIMTYEKMRDEKYEVLNPSGLLNILIHNDTEEYNKKNYFLNDLTNRILNKGWTYTILKDDYMSNNIYNDKEAQIKNLLEANLIDDLTYKEYINIQRRNEKLNRNQYYELNKYIYIKKWALNNDELNEEFLNKHYLKNHIITNYKNFNNDEMTLTKFKAENGEEQYKTIERIKKINMAKDIIKLCGYEIKDNGDLKGEIINNDNIKKIIDKYLTENKYIYLYNLKQISPIFDNNINNIISSYGYEIIKTSKTQTKEGNRKRINIYNIQKIDIINEYELRCKNNNININFDICLFDD